MISREVSAESRSRSADDVAQVRLCELGDGEDEVLDVVLELHGVGRLEVDDGVDGDDDVVLGDDLLRRNVDDLLPHVDLGDPLDERHDPAQARTRRCRW